MPRIVIQMKPGRPDVLKETLAKALTDAAVAATEVPEPKIAPSVTRKRMNCPGRGPPMPKDRQ